MGCVHILQRGLFLLACNVAWLPPPSCEKCRLPLIFTPTPVCPDALGLCACLCPSRKDVCLAVTPAALWLAAAETCSSPLVMLSLLSWIPFLICGGEDTGWLRDSKDNEQWQERIPVRENLTKRRCACCWVCELTTLEAVKAEAGQCSPRRSCVTFYLFIHSFLHSSFSLSLFFFLHSFILIFLYVHPLILHSLIIIFIHSAFLMYLFFQQTCTEYLLCASYYSKFWAYIDMKLTQYYKSTIVV